MCGGAIVADYIPPTVPGRPKKLTAEYLWPELKRSSKLKNLEALDLSDNYIIHGSLEVIDRGKIHFSDLVMENNGFLVVHRIARLHDVDDGSTAVKDVEATAVKLSPGSSSMKGGKIVWSDGKHNVTSPIVVTMHARL